MKYNLGMVTYVIPMFRYDRMDACEEIVDCMIERWNDHDLELKISKSEFEQIQGGFKSRLCYITTAVCASLGRNCCRVLRYCSDNRKPDQPDGKFRRCICRYLEPLSSPMCFHDRIR